MLRPLVLGLAAAWFSAQAGAQPMSYADRLQACKTCHGDDGNSRMEKVPSLAGQPQFFILNQLILMRETVRPVEAMAPFVKDLKDEEAVALATYFSKLAPKSEERTDPALVKRGEQLSADRRCGSCHLPSLGGQEQIPRIAGQRIDYLIQALKEFRDGTRRAADTNMSVPVAGMSDADLTALAHFAASR